MLNRAHLDIEPQLEVEALDAYISFHAFKNAGKLERK